VRRIEAVSGPGALRYLEAQSESLEEVATTLGASTENVTSRAQQLIDEKRELEVLLVELRNSGSAGESVAIEEKVSFADKVTAAYRGVRLRARNADDARRWGDTFLTESQSSVAVVAAELPGGKHTLFAFVTDDLIGRGVRADEIVREVAVVVGGRGGGRPHMAQAGVEDPSRLDEALRIGLEVTERLGREAVG
jgi:alanyl-tRNA synthetase